MVGQPIHRFACDLCEDRLDVYKKHTTACACHRKGCFRMSLPSESKHGFAFECPYRSKQRALKGAEESKTDSESATQASKNETTKGRTEYPGDATS